MVLAAGRGERLRPITDTVPKPLVPVGGKPLIVYHLEALARAQIHEIVINLSWLGEQIRSALGDGSAYGVSIQYSDEGAVALETGGGIFKALPLLGNAPFLLVNGDVWTDLELSPLCVAAAADAQAGALARLVLVPNPPQHPRGDFALEGEDVVDAEQQRLTYSGIGVYRPEFFQGCTPGRFPMLPLLKRAMANRQLRGQLYRGSWCDVGTPQRLSELDAQLRARGRETVQ